jgi:CheY-like chemotaxis protein
MDAIGQLTGGVAHDFNNLLMAVLGSLELLRKRVPDDPRLTRLIDNAVQGAERGAALTQRMLAFARKQELKLEPVDVSRLVHSMAGLLQPSLGPGFSLELDVPAGLPAARSDANQLETALLNLAVNARDAMGTGGVITIAADTRTVTETTPTGLPSGDYVRLSVSDAGEGMDEETMARAAEPFFTTKGVGKGTGLGLAMVHGLAAQSGGRLVLNSRKGHGTTAELWLPVAELVASEVEPEGPDVEVRTRTRPLVVLAVDDDALVLVNTAYMLEDLGHEVVQAGSGEEALHVVRNNPAVDLVITDQAMPKMTGVQLAAAIKAVRPELPVLLATGYAEMEPGADPDLLRLSKPFLQKDLAQAIAKAAGPVAADPVP